MRRKKRRRPSNVHQPQGRRRNNRIRKRMVGIELNNPTGLSVSRWVSSTVSLEGDRTDQDLIPYVCWSWRIHDERIACFSAILIRVFCYHGSDRDQNDAISLLKRKFNTSFLSSNEHIEINN